MYTLIILIDYVFNCFSILAGDVGEVVGRDRQGHYIIIFQHRLKPSSKLTRPFERRLGAWWVNHALEGTVIQLPIVNVQ